MKSHTALRGCVAPIPIPKPSHTLCLCCAFSVWPSSHAFPQDALAKDIAWARKNATPPDVRPSFAFKSFMMLSPCFSERGANADGTAAAAAAGAPRGKKAAKGGASAASASSSSSVAGLGPEWDTHYIRFEEELFAEEAATTFAFQVDASTASTGTGGAIGGAAQASSGASAAASASSAPSKKGGKGKVAAVAAQEAVPVAVGGGGKKGGGKKKAGGAAAREEAGSSDSEEDDEAGGRPLHLPQSRRFIIFPAASYDRCVTAMQDILLRAAST